MRDSSDQKTWASKDNGFQNDILPFLDTTIYVNITNVAILDTTITPPLTLNKSKNLLFKYFKKKDFYINSNVPPMNVYEKLPTNNKKGEYRLDVHFDTAYFLNLNDDKYYDAILEYELLPPYGCGHCLGEPNKAMVISNNKGYYLTGLEFIPDHYYFDSIKQVNPSTINLYGVDNDCQNWRINRHFKITITTK